MTDSLCKIVFKQKDGCQVNVVIPVTVTPQIILRTSDLVCSCARFELKSLSQKLCSVEEYIMPTLDNDDRWHRSTMNRYIGSFCPEAKWAKNWMEDIKSNIHVFS